MRALFIQFIYFNYLILSLSFVEGERNCHFCKIKCKGGGSCEECYSNKYDSNCKCSKGVCYFIIALWFKVMIPAVREGFRRFIPVASWVDILSDIAIVDNFFGTNNDLTILFNFRNAVANLLFRVLLREVFLLACFIEIKLDVSAIGLTRYNARVGVCSNVTIVGKSSHITIMQNFITLLDNIR